MLKIMIEPNPLRLYGTAYFHINVFEFDDVFVRCFLHRGFPGLFGYRGVMSLTSFLICV